MKIDHQNVHVTPVETRIGMSPVLESGGEKPRIPQSRSGSRRRWRNGTTVSPAIPGSPGDLSRQYGMEAGAARALVAFLARQRESTGADLPHRHLLLVEPHP